MTALLPLENGSLNAAVDELTRTDADLDRIVAACGYPPLWERAPGFSTLARIILEQQVSLASAASLFARLEREIPGGFAPGSILHAGAEGLQTLGLTRQKARYVHALAEMVSRGELPLAQLESYPDAEVASLLERVPGIGQWSSGIYMLMALRRPDVWPSGDLALHRMVEHLARSTSRLRREDVDEYAGRWRPLRGVAARVLWHGYLSGFRDAS